MSIEQEEEQHMFVNKQEEGEEEEEDLSWSSDSEIGDALDWLDSKDDNEALEGAFAVHSRRPNAHGGLLARPRSSPLQPLSNRNQKFSHHIRASPLEVRTRKLLRRVKHRGPWMFSISKFGTSLLLLKLQVLSPLSLSEAVPSVTIESEMR